MVKRVSFLLFLTAMFLLSACTVEESVFPVVATPELATVQVSTPTPTPEPTPEPLHDYGRDRGALGEYVYLLDDDTHYHEIECPLIYGECRGVLFKEAERRNFTPCEECLSMGDEQHPSFSYNYDFERSMNVSKKISLRDKNGEADLLLITTGDEDFDINNLMVNDPIRAWYKEFRIDPAIIEVHVRSGSNVYHNTFCEDTRNSSSKQTISLADAYAKRYRACSKCTPPTATWLTLPIKTPDLHHFYYANATFIRRALNEERYEIPAEMNIDIERIQNGFYENGGQ